jgi:glycosyltransferase involved in cell wall biosynthesis
VVENGVDAAHFQPGEHHSRLRTEHGLTGRPLLAYAGTFQPYEGLFSLLDALPRIRRQLPGAHLLIAGGPNGEAELRAGAKERGIAQHVTFTGRLPHERVSEVYEAADVMVYPRLLTRTTALTTPLKPLEAMSMGKPVLVSDVPALRELVTDGATGRAFAAGSAESLAERCVELLEDPAQARSLGNAAQRWVLAHRQWPQLVRRYPDIYEQALVGR